jgi:signal transduction histidine kinase
MALIINAADSMHDGGTLSIKSEQVTSGSHTQAVIEFKDSGCGIDPEHMPKIFDPFFTTKSRGLGTGLGLSICYGIITEHGGEITVSSTLGRGSIFRVLLPISQRTRSGPEPKREKTTTKGQMG